MEFFQKIAVEKDHSNQFSPYLYFVIAVSDINLWLRLVEPAPQYPDMDRPRKLSKGPISTL